MSEHTALKGMQTAPRAGLWLATGAIMGFLGVALGAFGAHALKGHLSTSALDHWATATEYLGVHSLALLGCGLLLLQRPDARLIERAAITFLAGIALFSGSLLLLALGAPGALAWLTPVGGMLLLAAWLLLALGSWRLDTSHPA